MDELTLETKPESDSETSKKKFTVTYDLMSQAEIIIEAEDAEEAGMLLFDISMEELINNCDWEDALELYEAVEEETSD